LDAVEREEDELNVDLVDIVVEFLGSRQESVRGHEPRRPASGRTGTQR
jgi:hypothetical protein